jgi:guanylate cyclase
MMMLLAPTSVSFVLGGFAPSSVAAIWAVTAPAAALFCGDVRAAVRWFIAFVALLLGLAVLEPWIASSNNLPSWLRTAFFGANLIGFSSLVFTLLVYFLAQRERAAALLRDEKRRGDELLTAILPEAIANELKASVRTIAQRHEGVTILFIDMVNFTPLSARLAPESVVDLLNQMFLALDRLTDEFGVEKIKTIGDCYMAAAGVPFPRSDHAIVMCDLALRMREHLAAVAGTASFEYRIGLGSGPVVAGVIGNKKFAYDLWGDAVNTASRMESSGQPGAIQIPKATYDLVNGDFVCEPRGLVDIKGKGAMDVWHLVGRRTKSSRPHLSQPAQVSSNLTAT